MKFNSGKLMDKLRKDFYKIDLDEVIKRSAEEKLKTEVTKDTSKITKDKNDV